MRFVPPEIIEEIRGKADIVEVISDYVNLKKQGKNYVGLCPFHMEDTPSFSVSPDKQIFYCFGCHKGGSVIHFIMEQENLTLPEAAAKLAEKVGVMIPENVKGSQVSAHQTEKIRLTNMHEAAADYYHQILLKSDMAEESLNYFKKRGISLEVIREFRLGFAPKSWDYLVKQLLSQGYTENEMEKAGLAAKSSRETYYDKFRNRIMFPIQDFRGKVIAFGGRGIHDELPKYLNSTETPIFSKSQNLYGLSNAAGMIRQKDEAVLMEGYMDVLTAHQFGIKNAVASLGTSLTPEQGKLLKRYSSNVLIAYDADAAGAKAAYRGLEILQKLAFRVRVLKLPEGMDPDDFLHQHGYQAWVQLAAEQALSLVEYKLQAAMEKYNVHTIEGKADVVQELLPDLAKIKSQVEKDQYIKLVASTLNISIESIYADLRQIKGIVSNKDNFSKRKHTNKEIGSIKSSDLGGKNNAQLLAEKNLTKLMIENRNIFDHVENTLGLNFSTDESITRILEFIGEIYPDFDWLPATLIERIDEENLKQYLSQLFMEDNPENINKKLLVRDYIKTINLYRLKKRMREIQEAIQSYEQQQNMTGDIMALLQELNMLQQQMQQLKE
ncbi:DNA primase [Dehalobacterium formicoaceticum]|uniref:DNA primase n=1 Tax=Dehalobacterium formicoaceticum TaxID=51515 RepID=A0ABT1XZP9_9FIRM|nr:DNA primase [Dehalobacterium formicoaceticum]MCR6544092.1 DNA primase [Dehalobacterium formicoaceticum]